MNANSIQVAAVLGAGTMGNGIAQTLAQHGIATTLYDVQAPQLERALGTIRANLEKGVAKGKLDAATAEGALKRLGASTDLAASLRGAHCVIEAVPERLELKQGIFKQ